MGVIRALTRSRRPCVLIVGPGPSQAGGVTTFIQILMSSELISRKYRLIQLDTSRAPEDAASVNKLSPLNLSYLLHQIWRLFLITIHDKPKVIHLAVTSGWSFWKAGAFLLIGRACGMRAVAHLHGGSFQEYYCNQSRPIRCLIGWIFKRADVVIGLSKGWQRFLLEQVRADLCVVVLPNSVDSRFGAAAEQDDYGSRQGGNVVLFVGQLDRAKGIFDILRAIPLVRTKHKDAVFVFAGGARDQQVWRDIQRCCAEEKLGNEAEFVGEITEQPKLDLFRRAALFVLPSYGEGLPYAMLEAMAVGLPVIATSVGAIPEVVREGHNGYLVPPGDIPALSARIIQLLEDMSLRHQMSLFNRQLILDCYLPDMAMTRLLNIYDKLI